VAEALVFKKVRQALGLENSWITLSGAAPMSNEVSEYFMSLNIPIMEVSSYDHVTEMTVCNKHDFRYTE
jgi:long-chain-fatty-acid--CoA ligase ACSBG